MTITLAANICAASLLLLVPNRDVLANALVCLNVGGAVWGISRFLYKDY
jgi:hypothetical protein